MIVKTLLRLSSIKKTTQYNILCLVVGAVFFLIILPIPFVRLGILAENYFRLKINASRELWITVLSIIAGLSLLSWSVVTQWNIGRGTPAPFAPTEKLVIAGPYKLCRNPIELGAVLYYLGIGTWWNSIVTGIVCAVSGLIIGSLYHKFVEEKELEARFGKDYLEYKKRVPFLIPNLLRPWQ
jgi:protein-S-isoprenylcysteine O-methyltransferase Ste14